MGDKIINNSLNLEEIKELKKKLRKIELDLKKNIKPKTITISNNVHKKMKLFCITNNIKINEWIEEIIIKNIK